MGCARSKIPSNFHEICKKQGYLATSPPIFLGKSIHTIDLDFHKNIYLVERMPNASIIGKYPARLELSPLEDVRLIYSIDDEHIVKDLRVLISGNIQVLSKDGNYKIEKNGSQFTKTVVPMYDILCHLYCDDRYNVLS